MANSVRLDPWQIIKEVGWSTKLMASIRIRGWFFDSNPHPSFGFRVRVQPSAPGASIITRKQIGNHELSAPGAVSIGDEADHQSNPALPYTSYWGAGLGALPSGLVLGPVIPDHPAGEFYSFFENGLYLSNVADGPFIQAMDEDGKVVIEDEPGVFHYWGFVRMYCFVDFAKLKKDFGPLSDIYIDVFAGNWGTPAIPNDTTFQYRVYRGGVFKGAANRVIENTTGTLAASEDYTNPTGTSGYVKTFHHHFGN